MICPICNTIINYNKKPFYNSIIHCYEHRISKLSNVCIEYKESIEFLNSEYLVLLFMYTLKLPKPIFKIILDYYLF